VRSDGVFVDFRARHAAAGAISLLALLLPAPALAAPEWVDRGLTMRQLGVSFDLGLGLAHSAPPNDLTGPGLNLEAAFGVLDNLEIGVRTGLRIGNDAENLRADEQGRLFDLETYGTGHALFANPELRILGRPLDLSVIELGLEGRVYLPFEADTRFSFMLGVPVRLHFGRIVRFDTGAYFPVLFYTNGGGPVVDTVSVNVPVEIWFQATRSFFLGPIAELRINDTDPWLGDHGAGVLLGVGLGYQISRFADLKAAFDFPRINGSPGPDFGAGVGLGLHFDQ
jgi:hypothetical protein